MIQDDKGQYANSGHALIFEGSILVYDPQCDTAQWVPVQGMSAALMMTELRMSNDLGNMVPSTHSKVELVRPLSPKIVKGIPAGTESDMSSSVIDSGDVGQDGSQSVVALPHPDGKDRSHVGRDSCHCEGR